MAAQKPGRPPSLCIDNANLEHNRLRLTRTRSSRKRSDARNHAYLKQHYAIPTPLHSPSGSRSHSRAGNRDESPHRSDAVTEKPDRSEDGVRGSSYRDDSEPSTLSWRQRIKHFTWTWFTLTMATGQLANVFYAVPYRFPGLRTIGVITMLFNVVLFIFNVTCISIRFHLYRSTFWSSLTHPTESLFAPAAVISLGTILMNITAYGVDATGLHRAWLERTMIVLFWTYCALALSSACGIFLIMWSTQTFTISRMTPVWIFPAYPLLVVAPHAALLASKVKNNERALEIIVGGFTLQGIGFMVSLMVYAAFLYRLMTNKLPAESLRPGMFISVGPSGFTVAGVVGLGAVVPKVVPDNFMGVGEMAGTITKVVANWMGVWLWGLAIFFLIVSVGAHWSCVGSKRMAFGMTWYSFVFPNTGLTTGTFAVGLALQTKGFQVLGCIFTVLLVITYVFVFIMMIRAVRLKQILWPGKQEDRDEGAWLMKNDTDDDDDDDDDGHASGGSSEDVESHAGREIVTKRAGASAMRFSQASTGIESKS